MGVIAMPIAVVLGGLVAYLVYRATHLTRPALAATTGTLLTAILMLLTIWITVPAGEIVTGALGFAVAAAVTGTRRVSETAARD